MECISSVSIVFGPGIRYYAGDCRFDVEDCLQADRIQRQFVVVMYFVIVLWLLASCRVTEMQVEMNSLSRMRTVRCPSWVTCCSANELVYSL